jgi:hypothetical protein
MRRQASLFRPLEDWSTGVLEYCKLMKSQTPNTIFKGFRCQEKETWKLKPPSVLHLHARVAVLLLLLDF